jgi:hypothetical protein
MKASPKLNKRKTYLWLVPAVSFSLLGLYDIGSAAVAEELTASHTVANTILVLPIVFHKRIIHLAFGSLSTLLWTYFLLPGMIEIPRTPGLTVTDQIIGFALILFFLLRSISLWVAGTRKQYINTREPTCVAVYRDHTSSALAITINGAPN